ncbi:elongator complex protein [Anaeramoeba ignava]|uniref:Elongator complex protein 2 n=1 Tax=Anaeramoeba ignava TaxID=1746090 RepID=A0A9Q0LW65_ANAIG|nr:elongator complex protein [Anaeramoeba ignava]
MISKLKFISAGINKTSQCLDIGNNNLICFGANNLIIITDLKTKKNITVLKGHSGKINCIKWINEFIISADSDGVIKLWEFSESKNYDLNNPCKCLYTFSSKIGSITLLDALVINEKLNQEKSVNQNLYIFCFSWKGNLQIWKTKYENEKIDEWNLFQELLFKPKFLIESLSTSVMNFPKKENSNGSIILATGDVTGTITLYISRLFENEREQFKKEKILDGHTDWIKALSFIPIPNENGFYLASGSQDNTIRIYKLSFYASGDTIEKGFYFEKKEGLYNKQQVIQMGDYYVLVDLETVLRGHDDWIQSLHWKVKEKQENKKELNLLSSGTDRKLVLWKQDIETSVWHGYAYLGEKSRSLGYLSGHISSDGMSIISHGFNSELHLWEFNNDSWDLSYLTTGHFNEINDLVWNQDLNYFITVSEDRTARIFAPWMKEKEMEKEKSPKNIIKVSDLNWYEIARPQIHGYSILSVSTFTNDPFTYISGSDERSLRVFQATETFITTFSNITNFSSENQNQTQNQTQNQIQNQKRPIGSLVPPLGLSNKALYVEDFQAYKENKNEEQNPNKKKNIDQEFAENITLKIEDFVPHSKPLSEANLQQNSLWPEAQKLIGHHNPLTNICVSKDGNLIFSACQIEKDNDQSLFLWNKKDWKLKQKISNPHSMDVLDSEFSFDNNNLLTVSRDRSFCVFRKTNGDDFEEFFKAKPHSNRIKSCSWFVNNQIFATGSLDKSVKLWKINNKSNQDDKKSEENIVEIDAKLEFDSEVTSIAFCPFEFLKTESKMEFALFAIGFKTGKVEIWKLLNYNQDQISVEKFISFPDSISFSDSVNRLSWKINDFEGNALKKEFIIAGCSNDYSVRLYEIILDDLLN